MINLIQSGFYGKTLHRVTRNVFNNFEINYAQIVYHQEKITRLKAKKIDWVDYRQMERMVLPSLDFNDLTPLDEKLVLEMINGERIVLKMMDRLGWFKQLSHHERTKKYYFYLRYWNHVIETKKINLFLAANVPHEIFDYVIYELCKLKKIPVLFLYHQSQIIDTALIMRDWKENSPELHHRYEYLKQHLDKNTIIKLSPRFEEHYQAQISGGTQAVPFYTKKETWSVATKKRLMKYLKIMQTVWQSLEGSSPQLFLRFGQLAKKQIRDIYLEKFYRKIAQYPDLTQAYIYVALQYQPERTTSPLADVFVDQNLMIQMLAHDLPQNVKIYVKEHPKQTSFCRSKDFYLNLVKIKNLVLIRKDMDSHMLINHAVAVATATGTPGWEALFREKPVLMFGSYHYQFADGVFKITTNDDCAQAIEAIFVHHKKPSLRSIRVFLKALEDVAIPAVIDPNYLVVSHLSEKTNEKNITNALVQEIKKIGSL